MTNDPTNKKYNVADLKGNLIDDRVIDGQPNMPLPEVTQRVTPNVGDDPHARMIDLICDLAILDAKGMGQQMIDFTQRARDILNVFEADEVRKKWNAEAPEPETNEGPFTVPRSMLKAWMDWADTGNTTRDASWDMRDEDGDLHSPSWYIEAFTDASNSYGALLSKDTSGMTPAEEMTHMHHLDDALLEQEMYARYVDRLFPHTYDDDERK